MAKHPGGHIPKSKRKGSTSTKKVEVKSKGKKK